MFVRCHVSFFNTGDVIAKAHKQFGRCEKKSTSHTGKQPPSQYSGWNSSTVQNQLCCQWVKLCILKLSEKEVWYKKHLFRTKDTVGNSKADPIRASCSQSLIGNARHLYERNRVHGRTCQRACSPGARGRGGVALAELGQWRGRTCGIQGGGSPSSQEALCLVVEMHKQINYRGMWWMLSLGPWNHGGQSSVPGKVGRSWPSGWVLRNTGFAPKGRAGSRDASRQREW